MPKRDYGSFAKAASKQLLPKIESLGYRLITNGVFGRDRERWIEGFFLSLSRSGSGKFSVIVGIDLPELNELWQLDPSDRSLHVVVSGRLSDKGCDYPGSTYHAANAAELKSSIEAIARSLPAVDKWFAKFKSVDDILTEFKSKNRLKNLGSYRRTNILNIIRWKISGYSQPSTADLVNYSFLLLVAGRHTEAERWLEVTRQHCEEIIAEHKKQLGGRKPNREMREVIEPEVYRLKVVKDALRNLRP